MEGVTTKGARVCICNMCYSRGKVERPADYLFGDIVTVFEQVRGATCALCGRVVINEQSRMQFRWCDLGERLQGVGAMIGAISL